KDQTLFELELSQIQKGAAYDLCVPGVIYGADRIDRRVVAMNSHRQSYSFALDYTPLRIEVDPHFNLMRRLDYREVPPALSKMFGADKTLMLLPASASAEEMKKYRDLSAIWKADRGDEFQVMLDSDIDALPADRSIWVLGWNNRWKDAIEPCLPSSDP